MQFICAKFMPFRSISQSNEENPQYDGCNDTFTLCFLLHVLVCSLSGFCLPPTFHGGRAFYIHAPDIPSVQKLFP
jgi:hypothetical protein